MRARENRQRRRKRDKRELERLVVKHGARAAYRATGKSPRYYDVSLARLKVGRGRSWRERVRSGTLLVKPNAAYHELMAELRRKMEGITWTVPPELLAAVRASREGDGNG